MVVNDFGLREDHTGAYDRAGSWVLAAAVSAGWAVGLVSEISEAALAVLFAFLAGGMIMNVLKGGVARGAREPILGVRAWGGAVRRRSAGGILVP